MGGNEGLVTVTASSCVHIGESQLFLSRNSLTQRSFSWLLLGKVYTQKLGKKSVSAILVNQFD